MAVIPFIGIVSSAKEIRFPFFKQDVQTLFEVPNLVLAGCRNDSIGLRDVKSVYVVIDVVWKRGVFFTKSSSPTSNRDINRTPFSVFTKSTEQVCWNI